MGNGLVISSDEAWWWRCGARVNRTLVTMNEDRKSPTPRIALEITRGKRREGKREAL